MTVICALVDAPKRVSWLGSSGGSQIGSIDLPESKASKWDKFGDWAIGIVGSSVARDCLEAERNKFPHSTDEVHKVILFMRAAMDKYEISTSVDGLKDYGICGILVHRAGALYDFDTQLAVQVLPEDTLWSRGAGMKYALGADEISKLSNFSPDKRVQYAVDAAIALDRDCSGQSVIEEF
ncbi:MAG: hypothetical protein V3V30_00360 [Parvularculaceae bacterium]